MEGEMKLDCWGYQVRTCSDACMSAINSYYQQVLSYGRKRYVILDAPKSDPQCVLGNILAAHFLCSADSSRAQPHIEAAKSYLNHASPYEKAMFDVLLYFVSPDRDDDLAVELHSKLLQDFPRDLVSLKRAQILCFYMGRPDLSLKLVEQSLAEWKMQRKLERKDTRSIKMTLGHNMLFAMFTSLIVVSRKPWNSWKTVQDHGILYRLLCLLTHNWWHVALCYLEGQAPMTNVRDIYDHCILKELERSDAVPAEVYLNAVGLLLRVYVRGELDAFGDRLRVLANNVANQAFWFLEWHLDILILWALSFTGEFTKAEDLLKGLKSRVSMMSEKKRQLMLRGLSLAECLFKYGKGDYEQALEFLGHEFDAVNFKIIGASDEQLDVFTEVYISLLLNTGEPKKAIQGIEKQLKQREGVPFLWCLLEKASLMLGRAEEAASYGKKARELEAAYFT
ncbi:uncharacterized protein [Henckelia pumila]|uniref:uncharacterized protein isoform X3 n=1 Tax=Henckelia pumila TaxID=405737 RepID=UPI003C6E2E84